MSALAHLLMRLVPIRACTKDRAASMYFGLDSGRSNLAGQLMSDYKITEEMVDAKALAMQSGQISHIERMVRNRETSRNALLREHERQQRRAAKQAKSAVPTIMKRRPRKKSRPRKRPHSNHGDREADCCQPGQCQAQHWPKNRGWPSKVQPQRVSARPVAGIAAKTTGVPGRRGHNDAGAAGLLLWIELCAIVSIL